MRNPRIAVAVAAIVALMSTLVGCATSNDSTTGGPHVFAEPEAGAYPVTLQHAYGSTTIDAQPKRVVVIGWSGADIAVDLGTVPVAQGTAASSAGGAYYPWFKDAVDRLGAPLPAVDESLERGEVDLEYVLSRQPDLILAVNSGITEKEYNRLSEIAPTVAFPGEAWSASAEEHIEIIGKALGRPARAAAIRRELTATLARTGADHPELSGKTFISGFAPGDDGQSIIFSTTDARVQTLVELGMRPLPAAVDLQHAAGDPSSFNVSLEQLLPLAPDLFLTVSTRAELDEVGRTHTAFTRWAPIADNRVALIEDKNVGLAFSTATPLGLRWGLPQIVSALSAAAKTPARP